MDFAQPPQAPAASISYWTEEGLLVTGYNPTTTPEAWRIYKAGLSACYHRVGIAQLADPAVLDRECVQMLWLISDPHHRVVAGVRWVGPVTTEADVDQMSIIPEIRNSTTFHMLRSHLVSCAVAGGVAEVKGMWSTPGVRGLGKVTTILAWHAVFWLGVHSAVAAVGLQHVIQLASELGAETLEGSEPSHGFPADSYSTVAFFLARHKFDKIDKTVRARVLRERAYLAAQESAFQPTGYCFLFEDPHFSSRKKALIEQGTQVCRHLEMQLEEAKEAGYGEEARAAATQSHPWVYFPWRNALVRLLTPDLFWKVRQDRNRYKLTAEEMDLLRSKRVGVIGMSVGSSIAYCLAQQGVCGELRIADMDIMELSNLNRLAGSVIDLGVSKVELARRRIAEINPYLCVRAFEQGVTSDNVDAFLVGLDVVVEECDSLDVKVLVRQRARHWGIPVVMETTDNGLLDVERFDQEKADLFHGLVQNISVSKLANLETKDKASFLLSIVEIEKASARGAASLIEIDSTLTSWPQLAEDISLGTALAVGACRRILLGLPTPSGRLRKGIDEMLESLAKPEVQPVGNVAPVSRQRPPLPQIPLAAVEKAAELAPSSGNAQAWRFEVRDGYFTVYSRDDIAVSAMDIERRATAVGCGAALCNAWCMASHLKQLGESRELPEMPAISKGHSVSGRFKLGAQSDDLAQLGQFIRHRCSNRKLGPSDALDSQALHALELAARRGGARLIYVPSERMHNFSNGWAETDRVRFLVERLHGELFNELKMPSDSNLSEGIDVRTLELSDTDIAVMQVLRRTDVAKLLSEWDLGSRIGSLNGKRLERCAGIVFVVAKGRELADHVRGGFAMELVWLRGTQLNISMQVVHPIFGYAHSAEELKNVAGPRYWKRLQEEKEKLYSSIGLGPDESFIIAMRVHRGPPPTAISLRRQSGTFDEAKV